MKYEAIVWHPVRGEIDHTPYLNILQMAGWIQEKCEQGLPEGCKIELVPLTKLDRYSTLKKGKQND